MRDRFGIGWRPELAAGILSSLDRIDVVEVIADDLFAPPRRELAAIETLAAQVPVLLHATSLGLSSSAPVERKRLDAMARTVGAVEPEAWSEHLAFVRGEGVEIGHLAAPPRTEATIEGTARNVARAAEVVGTPPLLENVATLIDPPGSTLDEPTWIGRALAGAAGFLLDLNNLLTNAVNFGRDPVSDLSRLPLDRVAVIHLAGGKWISAATGERRLLDDHLHDVPGAVYELLTELGARAPMPLTVVLERDGDYPPFPELLAQLDRARDALSLGRVRAFEHSAACSGRDHACERTPYRAPALEAYLARLYVDAGLRRRFLADPGREATHAGLDPAAVAALERIDRVGLELAARSFTHKRQARPPS